MNEISVHVCWRDERGVLDRLSNIEFTRDCETFAFECDPLDGDQVSVYSNFAVLDPENETAHGPCRLDFTEWKTHVGNILWDTITLDMNNAAKLVEYLRKNNHWNLTVAWVPLSDAWQRGLDSREIANLVYESEMPF